MPGESLFSLGNLAIDTALYLPAVTFPTLAANAGSSNTVTVSGVQVGDMVTFNLTASAPAHLSADSCYVSAANTVTLWWSSDATGITGSTTPILLNVSRPDRPSASLPSSLT